MLAELTIDLLREYREKWKLAPITEYKKLERLRTLMRFCQESGWTESNPAQLLKPPRARGKPVVAFSDEEMEKILWATELYPDRPKGRRKEVRAFVLLLRYSGLRIGDAISLKRASVENGRIFLRTAKTGTAVFLPLKREVIEALEELPARHLPFRRS